MTYQFGEKSKPNKKSDKSAFTLIEMVTSISLIVMITAIFMANYRTGNKRADLTMAAQEMVADIHAAQNNTLGLVKYGTEFPAGGWGVNFDTASSSRYVVFADLSQPFSDEPGRMRAADPGSMIYNQDEGEGDTSKGARIVDLPTGIAINSISSGSQTISSGNVTFLPPDPTTNIASASGATSTVLTIVLKDQRDGSIKTVRVNFLGLAEVID